jgi:hypothetical protein
MLIGLQCAVRALSYGSRKPRTSNALTTVQKAKIALLANEKTHWALKARTSSKTEKEKANALLQEIAELADTNPPEFARRVLQLRDVGPKNLRSLQYAIYEFEPNETTNSLEARIKALEDKLSGA